MDKLRSFNIDGETKTSTYRLKKIIEYIICVCVFTLKDRDTFIKDTDLNFAFKTFLERITSVKQEVGDEAFKEERHVLIFFTDGNFIYLLLTL